MIRKWLLGAIACCFGVALWSPVHGTLIQPDLGLQPASQNLASSEQYYYRNGYRQRRYSMNTALSSNRRAQRNTAISRSDRGGNQRSGKQNSNPIRNRTFYAGVTYPGIVLGAQSKSMALELRGYQQNDITIYGPRLTHYLYPFKGGNFYWGLDAMYIDEFEGDLTEGDGYMGGGFLGLQKYIGSRFSFNVDGGPYYVEIEDDLSGLDVDGFEFVVNTSINVHF